jgi:hypothetical protein
MSWNVAAFERFAVQVKLWSLDWDDQGRHLGASSEEITDLMQRHQTDMERHGPLPISVGLLRFWTENDLNLECNTS